MIFRVQDNYYYLVDIFDDHTPQKEQDFVNVNDGYIYEDDESIDLPFSISKTYIKDENGNYIVDEVSELEALKLQRMNEVHDKFEDMNQEGCFMCSLGFNVDNRRSGTKNDKDNIQSLIDLGLEPVYFRDHDDNFHELNIDDLKQIKTEMIQDGLNKYQWKWEKEQAIMGASTIQELMDIEI